MTEPSEVLNLLTFAPSGAAADGSEERFEPLISAGEVEIERIVSPPGHASPEGFWYDQERCEWVVVLAGRAGLEIEGRPEVVELGPGDALALPARLRHRVAWTSADEETIWLAVHYPAPD